MEEAAQPQAVELVLTGDMDEKSASRPRLSTTAGDRHAEGVGARARGCCRDLGAIGFCLACPLACLWLDFGFSLRDGKITARRLSLASGSSFPSSPASALVRSFARSSPRSSPRRVAGVETIRMRGRRTDWALNVSNCPLLSLPAIYPSTPSSPSVQIPAFAATTIIINCAWL